jgi:hypothetical protein
LRTRLAGTRKIRALAFGGHGPAVSGGPVTRTPSRRAAGGGACQSRCAGWPSGRPWALPVTCQPAAAAPQAEWWPPRQWRRGPTLTAGSELERSQADPAGVVAAAPRRGCGRPSAQESRATTVTRREPRSESLRLSHWPPARGPGPLPDN